MSNNYEESDSEFEDDEEDQKFMQMMIQKRLGNNSGDSLNDLVSQVSKTQNDINKTRETVNLSIILTYTGECLKKMKNYRVIGGKAIQSWLNPTYHGMSPEERTYAQSQDWDIEVSGTNDDAKTFIKNLSSELIKKFGKNFTVRLTDSMVLNHETEYVYQIGVEEERTTTWIVDAHAVKKIDADKSVKINGINYPKLIVLIDRINEMFNLGIGLVKSVKRFGRKVLLEKALVDIYYFNPEVYNEIFRQCKQMGRENMSGVNLNCEELKKFFPKSPLKTIKSPLKRKLQTYKSDSEEDY